MASNQSQPQQEPIPAREPHAARGPLVVATANPRYFTVAPDGQKAVYLTGSHIWNNLHDGMGPGAACAGTSERLDYGVYLDFLAGHGHNFIRLWRWEQFKSQAAGGDFHLCMTPQPWARTGPGAAKDGKPRFDLDRFDEAFFDRLRDRVVTAGLRGIYVAVMLFDGWALHLSPAPDHVEGHPFHAANNVNGVGIGPLFDSRAEWISPGYDDEIFAGGGHPMAPGSPQSRWLEDPPDPSAGGPMSYAAFEPARYAMGDTLRFADRIDLIGMEPRADLSSTAYALAKPGHEYLVLQPDGAADRFTVTLEPGT